MGLMGIAHGLKKKLERKCIGRFWLTKLKWLSIVNNPVKDGNSHS